MIIRRADKCELNTVLEIVGAAFGRKDEIELTESLLGDSTAEPYLSLLAFDGSRPAGHILFTTITIDPDPGIRAALLAPLSVRPESQRKGMGKALINYGLHELADEGVDAVFVLGHPAYYPKMGFQPAGPLGYEMPFPLPDGPPAAWMMRPIRPNIPEGIKGRVGVPQSLNKLEYWRV